SLEEREQGRAMVSAHKHQIAMRSERSRYLYRAGIKHSPYLLCFFAGFDAGLHFAISLAISLSTTAHTYSSSTAIG
ncbi:MAG TPA: hypothetical protein VGN34_33370, partial [Ktedonobacteraceae bacterium]